MLCVPSNWETVTYCCQQHTTKQGLDSDFIDCGDFCKNKWKIDKIIQFTNSKTKHEVC